MLILAGWVSSLNERDYYIFSQICLLTGTIALLIGGFLLQIYNMLNYINTVFLIFIFLMFFILGFYFHYKKTKIETEIMNEIKKYIDEVNKE
jgi:uncharacterized membrane protein YdjX (TVP38/TMEM64 family)